MQKSKLNLVLALVLSVLVGAVGGVLWGFLYYKGWFVAYVAFIMALAMFWIYAKFRDVDKLAYIWIMVWTIVICIVSCLVALVMIECHYYECPFGEGIEWLIENIEYNDSLLGDIIGDLVLSTIFAVLGVIFCYSYRKRKAQQSAVLDSLNGNIQHVDAVVVDDTPADDLSTDNISANNVPTDDVHTGEQSTDDVPTDDASTGDIPASDAPTGDVKASAESTNTDADGSEKK